MIDKINEISGAGAVGGVRGKRGTWLDSETDGQAMSGDGLAVSPFARELANVANELSKVPEVREAKVEQIKKQIETDTYNPDMRALAQRLVWAGITRSED